MCLVFLQGMLDVSIPLFFSFPLPYLGFSSVTQSATSGRVPPYELGPSCTGWWTKQRNPRLEDMSCWEHVESDFVYEAPWGLRALMALSLNHFKCRPLLGESSHLWEKWLGDRSVCWTIFSKQLGKNSCSGLPNELNAGSRFIRYSCTRGWWLHCFSSLFLSMPVGRSDRVPLVRAPLPITYKQNGWVITFTPSPSPLCFSLGEERPLECSASCLSAHHVPINKACHR